jgi:hypothetical protein
MRGDFDASDTADLADRPQRMPGAPHCTIAREARRGPPSGPGMKKAIVVVGYL